MVHKRRELEQAHEQRGIPPGNVEHTGEYIVKTRREDRSLFWRLTYYVEKFAALWIVLAALITGFGFRFVTPRATVAELRSVIDSNALSAARSVVRVQLQLDSSNRLREALASQHESLENAVTALVRMQCLDPFVSLAQKQLAGIRDNTGACIR